MPSDNKDSKDPHQAPTNTVAGGFSRQIATAMELPLMLVAAVALGGGAGFLLDRWLHTKPFLILIMGTLGFIGGLRDMLRRLAKQ
jgi:ATP synthase protein I